MNNHNHTIMNSNHNTMSLRSSPTSVATTTSTIKEVTSESEPVMLSATEWLQLSKTKKAQLSFPLTFENFVDLQTRLVLLPRVEEEGCGAVIASYTHPQQQQQHHQYQEKEEDSSCSNEEEKKDYRDDDDTQTTPATATATTTTTRRINTTSTEFVGCSLVGLLTSQPTEDWSDRDFTDILASLRETEGPMSLVFSSASRTTEMNAKSDTPATPATTLGTSEPSKQESAAAATTSASTPSQDSLQSGMLKLSAWGMRMRAQATEAATSLSSVAKERAKTFQSPVQDSHTKPANSACDMFLQTPVGAFIPVALAQSKVTTSSLLSIRASATEAAPRSGWSYQWLRDKGPQDAPSVASAKSSTNSSSPATKPPLVVDTTNEEVEWVPIEGATSFMFRANSTLIGRRLRCLVTMQQASSDDSSDDSDSLDSEASIQEEICEMSNVVAADMNLFNGARQALLRGAKFGNLKGRGNAAGRTFHVEVSIAMPCKEYQRVTSSLKIFQMSGSESVSLTPDEPLLRSSAKASSTNPKHLDLQITVSEDSVLSALCTDGFLPLEVPNRLTRESLLLTLGIANYTGKPADLDSQTLLFKDRPVRPIIMANLLDDGESSVSSGSVLSAPFQQGSPAKSLGPASPVTMMTMKDTPELSIPQSPSTTATTNSNLADTQRIAALEQELELLRGKLSRKDKVVSELQRKITSSDSAHIQTTKALEQSQTSLRKSQEEQSRLSQSLKKAESYNSQYEAKVLRIENEHAQHVAVLEERNRCHTTKIAELEKGNRALQNEKAVLQAAVEARESKLTRMGELQTSMNQLSSKVAQHEALRVELDKSNQRYEEIQQNLHQMEEVEQECRTELETAQERIEGLTAQITKEQEKAVSCHSQLDVLRKQIQLLKGERNNYKQKNDSLWKEVARVCKNGRSMKEVEQILAGHQVMLDEIESLRKHKRKALEEAHEYKVLYDKARATSEVVGVEVETRQALERTAELERLLAELTEYVTAKEMQLQTLKQVNEHLQEEIHSLAQAHFDKNDV